jgi:hypothetical protein
MDFLYFQVRAAILGNYKHDRLYGRGEEYGDQVINSAVEKVKEDGCFGIGSHESKSGEAVYFKLDGNTLIQEEGE